MPNPDTYDRLQKYIADRGLGEPSNTQPSPTQVQAAAFKEAREEIQELMDAFVEAIQNRDVQAAETLAKEMVKAGSRVKDTRGFLELIALSSATVAARLGKAKKQGQEVTE